MSGAYRTSPVWWRMRRPLAVTRAGRRAARAGQGAISSAMLPGLAGRGIRSAAQPGRSGGRLL
jgi:hypothetical protein